MVPGWWLSVGLSAAGWLWVSEYISKRRARRRTCVLAPTPIITSIRSHAFGLAPSKRSSAPSATKRLLIEMCTAEVRETADDYYCCRVSAPSVVLESTHAGVWAESIAKKKRTPIMTPFR
ncbi:unnamed protein product [Ectocarpus sp. 8 AP-2014]